MHHDLVGAQRGILRDRKGAFAVLRIRRSIPLDRNRVFAVAAQVDDGDAIVQRRARRQRKAATGLLAHEQFHRQLVACAQQRAVEDGMGDVRPFVAAGGHVETPRADAFAPRRERKGHVRVGARDDVIAAVFGLAIEIVLPELLGDARDAALVGASLPVQVAEAVAHRDAGIAHRRSVVQARHPDQRRFAAEFEMHSEIGDHCNGARVVRTVLREQRGAQFWACQLDDVEPRFVQRNADDFERTRSQGFGHLDGRARMIRAED